MGDVQMAQLRAFEAVARLGSYARAAEELSYSEPAVFLQMRALEKVLGVPLVRRRKKQVLLTRQGEQLLELAVSTLDQASRLQQTARGLQGRIIVGSGANTAVAWLMPLLGRYEIEHPEHHIELHTIDGRDIIGGVMEGLHDICFGGMHRDQLTPVQWRQHNLVATPWVKDEWVIFGPADRTTLVDRYRLSGGAPVRINYFRPWSIPRDKLHADLKERLDVPFDLVPLDQLEMVKGAVLKGLGLGILPRSASHGVGSEQFGVLDDRPFAQLTVSVVHRRARELPDPVRTFLAFILREARRIRRERLQRERNEERDLADAGV